MNKDFLDKYSKISIIVIGVILSLYSIKVISSMVYTQVYVPVRQEIADKRYEKENKIRNEIWSLRRECTKKVDDNYKKGLLDNCESKKGSGYLAYSDSYVKNPCIVSKDGVANIDEYLTSQGNVDTSSGNYFPKSRWSTCKQYYFCDGDFILNNERDKEEGTKACEAKYPE